jgi:acetylornithine deacetylase
LPAAGRDDRAAKAWCEARQLAVGCPVDFWTEASLFSAAGLPALVLGPGHIAQAHQTDEWVALTQLDRALDLYGKLVARDV